MNDDDLLTPDFVDWPIFSFEDPTLRRSLPTQRDDELDGHAAVGAALASAE